jgi:L-ribulokinase
MGHLSGTTYAARPEHRDAYDVLYGEYVRLHDLFGRGGDDIMRRLKRLQIEAAAVAPATA